MLAIVTRVILILVVIGASFASGYYYRTPDTVTRTKTAVIEKEKIVTKKVVERKTNADGTSTEKITETTTKDAASNKKADIKPPDPTPPKNNWAIGLTTNFKDDKPYIPTGASVDYRLIGDLWITGAVEWNEPQFTAGLKVEF